MVHNTETTVSGTDEEQTTVSGTDEHEEQTTVSGTDEHEEQTTVSGTDEHEEETTFSGTDEEQTTVSGVSYRSMILVMLPVPVGTAVLGGLPRAHTCTVLYGRYSSYSLYQVLSAWGGLRYLYWNSHTRC